MKTFIEAFYIIFMWNYFKTKYSFHNIWEAPLMNIEKMPGFFKHTVNTKQYDSKICPLGNWCAFFLAAWVIFRDKINDKYLTILNKNVKYKFNKIVFFSVLIISFIMNLNAFIYFIPVFYYELYFSTFEKVGFCYTFSKSITKWA
tara:strand:- start:465 stop:899 length:435 start_codon:yes stop_codon:yes gene_type:complete